MKDNSKYTFIVGKESEAPRVYQGSLLAPMQGFKLGATVAKLAAKVIDNAGLTEELKTIFQGGDREEVSDDQLFDKGLKFFVQCLQQIDIEEYMVLVNKLTKTTSIFAKVEGTSESTLLNTEQALNKWFSEFPQDLLMFTANILFRNTSPFLPEEFKNLKLQA